MAGKFKRILYGGDYNPNQWGREIWSEDMRIFRDARINSATVNVFFLGEASAVRGRIQFFRA